MDLIRIIFSVIIPPLGVFLQVGLGGQFFARPNSQDAVREFRPYFDVAPVYGHGPSLEEFTSQTPLTVGSPQQVIDRTLTFREYVGDYQRQLFLVDHAGLPLKTVLEQLDLLGEEVVPVLRREFDRMRPAHVPQAPTISCFLRHTKGEAGRPQKRFRRHASRLGGAITPGGVRRTAVLKEKIFDHPSGCVAKV